MLEKIIGDKVILRTPRMSDCEEILRYCSDIELSKWRSLIPHPYKNKNAVLFVKDCVKGWRKKTDYVYAIEHEGKLVGSIGLHLKINDRAELEYWIGRPYWGKGLATEAARLVLREGFKTLKLNKIYARYKIGNKGSERVMQKIGMKYECRLRDDFKKNGKYSDMSMYSTLRREYKP